MAQIAHRQSNQRKQKNIGSLVTVAIILLVIFVRNYATQENKSAPSTLPQAETQTTVQSTPVKSESAQSGSAQSEVSQPEVAQAESVQIVLNDAPKQKNDLPSLASAGGEPEKKKATPTAKPRLTRTPTRMPRATATATQTSKRSPPKATATATQTAKRSPPTATATPRTVRSESGLPIVYFDDLPREAQQTIRLIDKGGPFPYSRDGIEFQNRERILPRKQRGYYSEYTVITPGSNDRGARRIIAGENGELYYTDDHYDSFKEVVR